jgi:hypothetical protein
MLSILHNLNLKLCSKQYHKIVLVHLIVAPQLCSGWQHNYSTKTRQADRINFTFSLGGISVMSGDAIFAQLACHPNNIIFGLHGE